MSQKVKMYVAKDKNGEVFAYRTKPIRQKMDYTETRTSVWAPKDGLTEEALYLGKKGFDSVTWESGPMVATLVIEDA